MTDGFGYEREEGGGGKAATTFLPSYFYTANRHSAAKQGIYSVSRH
jgi:hypothetical protein